MLKLGKYSLQFIISRKVFPQISHYTTSTINDVTSNILVVDYLVNSLGFSKKEAILTSSKVSSFESPAKPNSVVNFLKSNGFNEPQIRAVVSSYPKILFSDVKKTLQPKLDAFHDFGICRSELADIISVHPHVFYNNLIPALRTLKSIFGDDLILLEALKKSSWMLSRGMPRTAPLNVALLKSYGLSVSQIKTLFLRKWRYFALDPKWLQGILIRVEEKIGIPRGCALFLHGICAIGGLSKESLEAKFKIFKSFGWNDLDILTLARRSPYTLALSESKIRAGLDFYMKELGHEPAEISKYGCVLTVSLEKRVIPRNEVINVLKEKRLINANYKIFSCLAQSEVQFFNKFVLPFKDDVLDVYTDYMTRAGASVTAVP